MHSTSESLLIRLTSLDSNPDRTESATHGSGLSNTYTPVIFYWARKVGLQSNDAADLVQDVLATVIQKLPHWKYDPDKSFRGWLRMVTLNRHREIGRKKRPAILDANASAFQKIPNDDMAESTWDINYARQLVATAMELMQDDFAEPTWLALKELMASGGSATEIAKKHSLSVWTLYSAKSRILGRLRSELDGLL